MFLYFSFALTHWFKKKKAKYFFQTFFYILQCKYALVFEAIFEFSVFEFELFESAICNHFLFCFFESKIESE
jgi:hypothetical protein